MEKVLGGSAVPEKDYRVLHEHFVKAYGLEGDQAGRFERLSADYLERIVYFLDNELDEADCSAVRMHLDECGPCLQKYDLERTVKAVVARSCHESAPEALRSTVGRDLGKF